MKAKQRPNRSAFWTPLDEVLSAEANVRILREIASSRRQYFTPGELAARTDLTRAAVYRALDRLFNAGVIEYGVSGGQRCRLSTTYPFARPLAQLFRSEAKRAEAVMSGVRVAAEELSPPPISVWVEGAVATGHDEFGDPIVVGLLDIPEKIDEHVEALQENTVDLQRDQDVTIEIRGRTKADLRSLPPADRERLAHGILIFGVPVDSFVAAEKFRQHRAPREHRDLEDRSLAYGGAIAQRIKTQPELVDRARDWLANRMERVPEAERRELREWDRILRAMTPARLRRFLVDPSQRAVRLRQSNPFVGALTQDERNEILKGVAQ